MTKNDTYKKWADKQREEALNAFVSEITGEIPENRTVEYYHKLFVGGSTDAVLLGLSPYATPNDAYNTMYDMTPQSDKFVFRYGHYMEKFIATEFQRITHIPVKDGVTLFDKDRAWSMAQIDYLLDDETPLEIKTTFMNLKGDDGEKLWGKGCEFNEHGQIVYEDDTIPPYYYVQCQKQLYITGKDFMYLACLISAEDGIRIYKIHKNEEIIAKIIEAEDDFIFNHVIPRVPYVEKEIRPLETVDEHQSSCYATEEFITMLRELQQLQKEKNEIAKRVECFTDAIREYLGEHNEAVDAQGNMVVKQTSQSRLTLDVIALKNDHADIVANYYHDKPIASKITINKKYFKE